MSWNTMKKIFHLIYIVILLEGVVSYARLVQKECDTPKQSRTTADRHVKLIRRASSTDTVDQPEGPRLPSPVTAIPSTLGLQHSGFGSRPGAEINLDDSAESQLQTEATTHQRVLDLLLNQRHGLTTYEPRDILRRTTLGSETLDVKLDTLLKHPRTMVSYLEHGGDVYFLTPALDLDTTQNPKWSEFVARIGPEHGSSQSAVEQPLLFFKMPLVTGAVGLPPYRLISAHSIPDPIETVNFLREWITSPHLIHFDRLVQTIYRSH